MEFILVIALVFSFMSIGSSMLKSQDSQADYGYHPNKYVLDDHCCESLKNQGYFQKMPSLKTLCARRFYCVDRFSLDSCNHIKKSKECDTSAGIKYCQYTCNKCTEHCHRNKPLGMENGAIPDSRITASTYYSASYRPSSARLHGTLSKDGHGWCTKTNTAQDWIQVDLGKPTQVTAVATQGARSGAMWVTRYTLSYSNDGKAFTDYQGGKVFTGNFDQNTVVKKDIKPAIYARYIRLTPKAYHSWKMLRMELYGCK